jgi:2-methylcitrate dehydratase PrpD
MHLLPARAASSGTEAALLARVGCDSGDEALAGPHGFFAAFGGGVSPDGLLDGLGEHFELMANTYKPYPCGIVIHPVIDACLEAHPRVATRIEAIEEIRLVVAPQAIALADRRQPASELEAQVSLHHWAAAALMFGRAGIDEGQIPVVTGNESIARLRARCIALPDPARALDQAGIEIRLADGSEISAAVEHCRGSVLRPLTDAELDAKFVAQATRMLGEAGAQRALAACRSIAEVDGVAAVTRDLVP